jgi:hypothetical protein
MAANFTKQVDMVEDLDYNVQLVQQHNNIFYQISKGCQDHQSKLLDESASLTLAGKDIVEDTSQAQPALCELLLDEPALPNHAGIGWSVKFQ